ncbi:MAG: hypothetical protein JNJ50_24555 [Acidobacteria bacterium]|nr:hypothetical protein [Acidobacteriota bacterium]
MNKKIKQPPFRNASFTGVRVCSHSGEFFSGYTDLAVPGRGISFEFIRTYLSFNDDIGLLGRGWVWNYAKRLEEGDKCVIYHDGYGREFVFTFDGTNYDTPDGLYCVLAQSGDRYVLSHRYGVIETYETPSEGGRLLEIEDRTDNVLQFSYFAKSIVVVDSLSRKLTISVDNGLITQLQDHANRTWKFNYDKNLCLIEVEQPTTKDHPNGTSIRYEYDDNHRLISITDAKGQTYLRNYYDDETGRVIVQEHGRGAYQLKYEEIRTGPDGSPILKTTTILKNGGTVEQVHTDEGHEELRTIYVNKDALSAQDMAGAVGDFVPLSTESEYNQHGELVRRKYPSGLSEIKSYNDKDVNALARGNLLETIKQPAAGIKADQNELKTRYKYEGKFQFTTSIKDAKDQITTYAYDERGNLITINYPKVTIQPLDSAGKRPAQVKKALSEKFTYNLKGQLLSKTNTDGSVEEYFYYPENDPTGKTGKSQLVSHTNVPGGYLCRVVRDAKGKQLTTEFAYDPFGNVSETWDGKGNSTKSLYNAMGYLEKVVSRAPLDYEVNYRYDANYNLIEEIKEVEHYEFDETAEQAILKKSTYRVKSKFNELDNLVERRFVTEGKEIVESFIRDEDERLIRHIQPLGNITDYEYDERDCVVLKAFSACAFRVNRF